MPDSTRKDRKKTIMQSPGHPDKKVFALLLENMQRCYELNPEKDYKVKRRASMKMIRHVKEITLPHYCPRRIDPNRFGYRKSF